MTPQEAQQYLNSFINYEKHSDKLKSSTFKLERTRQLLKRLSYPQKNLKIIHVAGSKGKGSVCAITANILYKAGYRVGLYTSPHINNCRERIRLLQDRPVSAPTDDIFPDAISEMDLCLALEEIKPVIEQFISEQETKDLSFFEVYTVLALYYFSKQKADFVVLETGMGGRLDATNAVDSLVAVITPISLEHTHILGDTVEQIAKEKAAIIKSVGQKAVIARQDNKVKTVLRSRCREYKIDHRWVENYVEFKSIVQDIKQQTISLKTLRASYAPLTFSLAGRHQRENASVAICIIECLLDLGFAVSERAIKDGFKTVFWPGRFEVLEGKPLFILDSAHNEASAKVLVETVKEVIGEKKVILVLGMLKDKDKESISNELGKISKRIIFTKANHPRADDLEGAVSVSCAADLACQEARQEDIVLVAGSVFVVSEARAYLTMRKEECIN